MRDGSHWAYVWGLATGALAALSAQDLIYAAGAAITGLIALLTYLSNNKRNERVASALERRNELLETYVSQSTQPSLTGIMNDTDESDKLLATALDDDQ